MLDNGSGHPVLQGSRPQEAEFVLSQLITAAVMVESLAGDLTGQVQQARMIRIVLLAQEMEQLVQDLQAMVHGSRVKIIKHTTQGIVKPRLPH